MGNNNNNLFSLILTISMTTMIVAGIIFASYMYALSGSNSAEALTKLLSMPLSAGGPHGASTSATSTASSTNTLAQGTSRMNTTMLPQPTPSSQLLTYQNLTAGFKIEYPSFWQKSENITSNSSAVFFSEPLSGVRFTAVNFKIPQTALLNEPKNLILNTYLNGFTQPFQPYNSIQSASNTIGGNPVNKTELTYSYAGHPARITILSSLIRDKVYILSYAATKESYALFLPTAQQMINSFSILPAVKSTSAILTNQTAVPRSNATSNGVTAAMIMINVDACNPKSQNPLSPKSVTVQVGGMVNWTNGDKLSHEFVSGTPNALTNLFDSGLIDPGKTAGVIFKKPGTFSYFDDVCNNLNGTISVVQSHKTQQAVTPGSINSTKLPRQLITSPAHPNATASTQTNATSKPLPQPHSTSPSERPNATLPANITGQQRQQLPSQKPAAPQQQPTQPLQQQQQTYNQGFNSKGAINSLIKTHTAAWIATGNWIMNVDNGTVTLFDTNMTWYNNNGATSHTHEFQNFKPTSPAKITLLPNTVSGISFKGVMDVGTNHRIVWKNVPTTININGEKTITISVADNATNHHFAGQPIFGLVSSFVPCSEIPGPNMEILPPCSSQH
jgi:plastocyanin